MNIKVKKLWLGHASVRDYKVRECIKRKEDLTIDCNGRTKTFPYKSLGTYLTGEHMTTCVSKFNGEKYTLVDFPWDAYGV